MTELREFNNEVMIDITEYFSLENPSEKINRFSVKSTVNTCIQV